MTTTTKLYSVLLWSGYFNTLLVHAFHVRTPITIYNTQKYVASSKRYSLRSFGRPSNNSKSKSRRRETRCYGTLKKAIEKDVVIIGGGLAGLSAALYLATDETTRHVTVLESMELQDIYSSTNTAGSFAAAGMLAPQSERLPPGPLLDLCLKSRSMYPDFVTKVETYASEGGSEGEKLLWKEKDDNKKNKQDSSLKPWEVGFHATGGFLAPAFAGDSVATWAPPSGSGNARWLDKIQVKELEPELHPSVVGGWWFPEDASVDARRLTCSLRAACVAAGVHLQFGKEYEVTSLELQDGHCKALRLHSGKLYSAKSIIVANGSWMRNLLPVPITPHKGQSLSLRMPSNQPPILNRVLFAQDTYIVPKADGRIIVGATVEPGCFDPSVTPAGMLHCIENACRLLPGLKDLPIEEMWSGLRPTTPDKAPIMGRTSWDNLFLAGGYWRNGVLLAPKTGQLIGDLVQNNLSEEDSLLLDAFNWERFVSNDGGSEMALNSRYASSFYPTQQRAKGFGVSAAVGTELGFYSDASSAREERAQDRAAMFGDQNDKYEEAAGIGISDAKYFTFSGGQKTTTTTTTKEAPVSEERMKMDTFDDLDKKDVLTNEEDDAVSPSDARTAEDDDTPSAEMEEWKRDMSAIYETIKANKEKSHQNLTFMSNDSNEERPDPGFRIYHKDRETGALTEVPPYTKPEDFEKMLKELKKAEGSNSNTKKGIDIIAGNKELTNNEHEALNGSTAPDESTYDGYVAIQEAYGNQSWETQREQMKQSRQSNRFSSEIDDSAVGAASWDLASIELNDDEGADDAALDETIKASPELQKENKEETSSNLDQVSLGEDVVSTNNSTTANEIDIQSTGEETTRNLTAIYSAIIANKEKNRKQNQPIMMGKPGDEERPDPGFRIYHKDSVTGELTEVPPYTRPEEFEAMLKKKKEAEAGDATESRVEDEEKSSHIEQTNEENVPDEKTFDGYVTIQEAYESQSWEKQRDQMKKSRQSNRFTMEVDNSAVGAASWESSSHNANSEKDDQSVLQ